MAAARRPVGQPDAPALIRAYHAGLAPAPRRALKALEAAIRAAAPGATRAFSYRIPAFALHGRILVWCAGWEGHVGMYPVSRAMQAAGGDDLAPFRHGRGTLRFPLGRPLPRRLIARLIRARVAELAPGKLTRR